MRGCDQSVPATSECLSQVDHWLLARRSCSMDTTISDREADVSAFPLRFELPTSQACASAGTGHRRFERLAVSSVFGDPLDRRTWSGAPYNVIRSLQNLGIAAEGIHSGFSRGEQALLGVHYLMQGYGRPPAGEALLRIRIARRRAAERLAAIARRRHIRHILHTGTLDMPIQPCGDLVHYLYCDHTWALSLPYRSQREAYSAGAIEEFDSLERAALGSVEHVFTFGAYVREHMISHYGLAPDRVTAVGSGMGQIEPYAGAKDYTRPHLLFIAKHLFMAKGGGLVIEAFRLAREIRSDLTLTIVGDSRSRAHIPLGPGIKVFDHLPWRELQRLLRMSTLLVQPMLNDPWGQVYLEALLSRTPAIGLHRNGLPEILENGRHGFLVKEANPAALAEAILDALSDPLRLAAMGLSGQRHVLQSYSWDRVAQAMATL
jgi:glycosyltransferase involved in cell wall biosynthesis